jgi:hypothetical protein
VLCWIGWPRAVSGMGRRVQHLPQNLAAELRLLLKDVPDPEDLGWRLARLAEEAYAEGYSDGYLRGHQDGWDQRGRDAETERLAAGEGGEWDA